MSEMKSKKPYGKPGKKSKVEKGWKRTDDIAKNMIEKNGDVGRLKKSSNGKKRRQNEYVWKKRKVSKRKKRRGERQNRRGPSVGKKSD
jgi:hypothetical protein